MTCDYRCAVDIMMLTIVPLRQTLYTIYEVLALCLVVNWANPGVSKTRASVPTAVITLVGYLALPILSYAEHVKSVRPSPLLNGYLSLSLLCDVTRARTLWLRDDGEIASDFTAGVAVKFVLLLLEVAEKRRILLPSYQSYPFEATSGLFSRFFFCWLNPLFHKGLSKTLSLDDLYGLDKHLVSDYLDNLLNSAWLKGHTTISLPCKLLLTRIYSTQKNLPCLVLDHITDIEVALALCGRTSPGSDCIQFLPTLPPSPSYRFIATVS
jgi:ATP-binding cassette, subfamily C (CFTR/MRP), member 1